MAEFTASPDIIIVDADAGETSGASTITYKKERDDELWERRSGGVWSQINVHILTGLGDQADFSGQESVELKPGQNYEIGAFQAEHGPLTTDPIEISRLIVFCLLKKPTVLALITDQNRAFGGTWYWHQVATSVPTSIVSIAVSRRPPEIDSLGILHPVDPDGVPTAPFAVSTIHKVEINPILPGNAYFFSVVVVDGFGNWDVKQEQFTALRRIINVDFPTIHIYNDGDPLTHGEGEFWFRVYSGPQNQPVVIKEFHQETKDIDDWGETDRPYSTGFTYFGPPTVVTVDDTDVSVSAWGIEHDGVLEADESAWSRDARLFLPVGRFAETANGSFTLDCPTANDADFHYGTDVKWSVIYVP